MTEDGRQRTDDGGRRSAHLSSVLCRPSSVVREARSWIGTPYRHQGTLKGVGADCLGLVRGVWREIHGSEPEATPGYRPGWAEAEKRERLAEAAARHMLAIGVDEWDAGDLLLFRWRPHLPAKHAAIATSKASMVHAQDGAAVCEVPISPWWRRRIAYCFRFPYPPRPAKRGEGRGEGHTAAPLLKGWGGAKPLIRPFGPPSPRSRGAKGNPDT